MARFRRYGLVSEDFLRDTRTVSVHFDEPHWIAGRVSKQTKHDYAGNFESWHVDCATALLNERKASANVWHAHVNSLLSRVFADCTLDWSGNRDAELPCFI